MGGDIIYKLLAGYVCFLTSSVNAVQFKLLTSYDRNGREINVNTLTRGTINPLKKVIVLVGSEDYQKSLSDSYLEQDNYNLFTVQWNETTVEAGDKIGQFLNKLLNATGERYLDFHLIGIEDGCNVCRTAADEVLKSAGRKVNRFTEIQPGDFKNDLEKADFVDLISCKEPARTDDALGGNVNFYLHSKNKDCNTKDVVNLFAKSIATNDIEAKRCEDYKSFLSGNCENNEEVVFGQNVNNNIRGTYFLNV